MQRLVKVVLIGTAASVLIAAPARADGGHGHRRHHHHRHGTEQTTQEPAGDPSDVDPTTVDDASTPAGSLDDGATSATSDATGPNAPTDASDEDTAAADRAATDDTEPDATDGAAGDEASGDGAPSSSGPVSHPPSEDASEPALDDPRSSVSSGDQTVTVTGVAVAVSTSGGNTLTDGDGDGDAPGGGGGDVATGAASAVGNQDQTTVSQQATTNLSGGATADVRQVTIVFNVGVAAANSGANSAAGGSGSITTGNATAVGNDGVTYLTQAGAATAPDGTTDSSNQVTVTVRVGVAVADSGGNTITGGGASGSVHTGTATATGNHSLTDVSQTATLTGSGVSQLTVEQQALILNLGVALANSGVNDVNGLASALLDAPSQDLAEQLFSTLLPALLASAPSGGGDVATGDATAVGNQSQTYVDQTATATAAGDGSATISQHVVVANVGAALANSGLNNAGGTVALDPQMISDLAALFNDLLTTLDEWTAGDGASRPLRLVVPFGDLLISLDGDLVGVATTIGSGEPGSPLATISQLTAIISLGVSYANSGLNTTSSSGAAPTGGSAPASIVTGDVSAVNASVVIVCQLDDDLTHPCLAPVVASSPPAVGDASGVLRDPARSSAPSAVARDLPATGLDADLLAQVATVMVLGGVLLVLGGRRSAHQERAQ